MVQGLDEVCTRALAEHGCPSVSVAVAERGRVVLARAYGTADPATGRPATPGTAYPLASVTKPMTATAVCAAADDGLLDLDTPVPRTLGDFGGGPAPTPRQLLQHRGGLGAYYDWDYGDGAPLPDADRYTVLHRPPGSGFEYANLGYRVLGRLLELRTGRPAAAFVRERVLAPLGLTGSHLGRTYPGPAPAAVRHTADGRRYPDTLDCSHPGATLGWAPAGELALFAQTCRRLLAPDTAAAVADAPPITGHVGYGLGWVVSTAPGPVVHSHGGGGPGAAAMLVSVPARDLSVAVLTNSTDKGARDAVLGHLLPALVPGHRPELIQPYAADPPRPHRIPEGTWTGRVAAPERDVPARLHVLPGGRITLRLDGPGGPEATAPAAASATRDLRAALPLQLPTADARISSPSLLLALTLHEGRLTGTACAYKDGDREGRLGNFIGQPCEFRPA
ncbi:serine hydrolase [Kitasatospora sp. NE20-6]|uniref:serine hydrolase domain-containing protein n=1 Tax=Kitasatospora sp. NE20-6 TaxID=2859066 RepID=UPI0034DCA899